MEVSPAVLWIAAGLVMMLLEMAVPGVFLLWLGLAALGTGIVVHLLGAVFWIDVLVFALLAAASIALALRLRGPKRASQLNTPTSGLVGREALALEFHGRTGRVRVGDSDWNARLAEGAAAPAPQSLLRVVGVEGTTLVVGP
jgi:membrane protein implicated in regulation of membrane protease activity